MGYCVSSGVIGTVQLIYFKQFWTTHFSDMTLMIGGLTLFAAAQLLVINWGPVSMLSASSRLVAECVVVCAGSSDAHVAVRDVHVHRVRHRIPHRQQRGEQTSSHMCVFMYFMCANIQVLGVFSSLQKAGKQAKAQGQFAFMGSLARVVMPIATGYLEQYVEYSSSFSMVLILMSFSLIGVALLYSEIVFFSSPTLASQAVYDSTDPAHKLSTTSLFMIGLYSLTALVALMATVDFGVPGW